MAKVLFAAGIEEVSGAASKINTKSQHSWDQNMLLFTHRKAASANRYCQRGYYRKINSLPWQNAGEPSTEVLERREAFATAVKQVNTRKNDLSKITADQEQYAAIREAVIAKGYLITMNSFLWAAQKLYGAESFPTIAITMTAEEYVANTGSGK